ncbi:sensor histidine kinase inhibitor, KipI family [Actinopolyspora mzabensis]|uniref:Sensor histidine kinase inhibitor, KipI family n=1 Tax=Actinopolyspora mzabensis TaxID=995066 RepID=A0A1G9FP77_ACTMZ|nr:allophanate hydrolase subunit 1 [Actinopolyspora mzabensis]SDK90179.1 sensor histidine kinase inhibitor, KipI family [Actinopolyspora mzabensis]
MRILPCADAGLLVELDELEQVLALHAALSERSLPGVLDLIPAARTLLVSLDPERADRRALAEEIRRVPLTGARSAGTGSVGDQPAGGELADRGLLTVPVIYDGADLDAVAELTGLSPREVVDAHTGTEWRVAFGGFAPGFGYLVGGDPRLEVPRRAESRTGVPAGSVGLAGRFSGVYPRTSPGGWQLIGRTELEMWRTDREPPALLRPGVRVRFEEVS